MGVQKILWCGFDTRIEDENLHAIKGPFKARHATDKGAFQGEASRKGPFKARRQGPFKASGGGSL